MNQNELYEELQKYPDYQPDTILSPTFDEQRHRACRQNFIYKSIDLLSISHLIQNLKYPSAAYRIMIQLAPSSTIKFSVTDSLFSNVILSMGSARHEHFMNDSESGRVTF